MADWHFSDIRLSARAEQIYERIVAMGSLVLRRVGGDRAGEIAAHRFLDNDRVSTQAIVETLSRRTLDACAGRRIVAVQDTTEINFAGRDASRTGLGQAGGDKSVGFFIHPLIAVDIESCSVLGLVDVEIWTRDAAPIPDRRRRPFAERESARWLRGIKTAQSRLTGAGEVIVVGDRESDIYSLFAHLLEGVQVIVRASHNRKLKSGERLFDAACRLEEMGPSQIDIAAKPGKKARQAKIMLNAGKVTLTRPRDSVDRDDPTTLDLNVVEAVETNPPKGVQPVCWRLLTTLPVASPAEVEDVVKLYRLRWRIEEVFRVLKSDGLDLQATQVEAAERLFKLAALGLAAAARIVQLVDARDGGSRSADDVADPELFDAIETIGKTLEGGTARQKNPHQKNSLAWLAWIVARLGGWNCYYKPPGPKTMATGWKQLASMITGFILASENANV
jgi:hypothetical protein